MANDAFEYKDTGFKMLKKLLAESASRVKVGIPSDKDARAFQEQLLTKDQSGYKKLSKKKMEEARVDAEIAGDYASNATIGMKHEFGQGVPVRSFLRVPLSTQMQKFLDNTNAFSKDAMAIVMQQKNFTSVYDMIGGYNAWTTSGLPVEK